MDDLMPIDQCEQEFRHMEQLLDEALGRLRTGIDGIVVVDHSNRSGFEKSGFPYFLWEMDIERTTEPCPFVSRAAVKMSFLQPFGAGEPGEVELTSVAERYMIGSQSFFRRTRSEKLPTDDLTATILYDACRNLLTQAEAMLGSEPVGAG